MNISIFASVWCQNLGDELIVKNELELLRKEFWDDAQFFIASYDVKNPFFQQKWVQYFEYFPFWSKNPRNFFRNIRNFFIFLKVISKSDRVVIGGWGIMYDKENQSVKNPLDQWVFRAKIARFFWKKIYFYALWIDVRDSKNIKKLKSIFYKAWKVTVRDKKSQGILQDIWVSSQVVPDPVMQEGEWWGEILWKLSSRDFTLKDLVKHDFRGKRVGLALRSGYLGKSGNPNIETLLIEELCQHIENAGGSILFLPQSFHTRDILANDAIFLQQFLKPGREICMSMGEVYTIYSHKMVSIVISMRLHSMILAYVYGINQIALSYSQKTEEFLRIS